MIGDFNEQLKDIIVWDKGVAQPAMQKQVLNRRTELILVFETDYPISRQYRYANFERGKLNDIWEIKRGKKISKNHGAVFPEELVFKILENFSPINMAKTWNYSEKNLDFIESKIDTGLDQV